MFKIEAVQRWPSVSNSASGGLIATTVVPLNVAPGSRSGLGHRPKAPQPYRRPRQTLAIPANRRLLHSLESPIERDWFDAATVAERGRKGPTVTTDARSSAAPSGSATTASSAPALDCRDSASSVPQPHTDASTSIVRSAPNTRITKLALSRRGDSGGYLTESRQKSIRRYM